MFKNIAQVKQNMLVWDLYFKNSTAKHNGVFLANIHAQLPTTKNTQYSAIKLLSDFCCLFFLI